MAARKNIVPIDPVPLALPRSQGFESSVKIRRDAKKKHTQVHRSQRRSVFSRVRGG